MLALAPTEITAQAPEDALGQGLDIGRAIATLTLNSGPKLVDKAIVA